MSDDRPPLQDPHLKQLCLLVLEYGMPFPERFHEPIAQRLMELMPPLRNRGVVVKVARQRMSNGSSGTASRKPKRAN
jgi:hypothetical protein